MIHGDLPLVGSLYIIPLRSIDKLFPGALRMAVSLHSTAPRLSYPMAHITVRCHAINASLSPTPPPSAQSSWRTASLRPLHAPSQSRRAIYRPRAERYAKREPTARGRIGSHVGRNTAHLGRGEGGVAILTHFFTFISIFRGGRGSRGGLLHRAGGGSSVGKRGKIPLLTLLTAFYLAFYDFYLWKIVEFCKNRHLSQ